MTRLLKNISAIVVIAMIIAVIAIPAFAAVNALSYSASWSASDIPGEYYAWATLSYSGGNGSEVYSTAYATTNLHLTSTISEWSLAVSASYIGPKKPYSLNAPFVIDHGGSAYYAGN